LIFSYSQTKKAPFWELIKIEKPPCLKEAPTNKFDI
jgi:hypothetical protein